MLIKMLADDMLEEVARKSLGRIGAVAAAPLMEAVGADKSYLDFERVSPRSMSWANCASFPVNPEKFRFIPMPREVQESLDSCRALV